MEPFHIILSLIGFGILATVVIGLLFVLRALNRGEKGKSDGGKVLKRVEETAASLFEPATDQSSQKGPSHGELLDEAEAFGAKFVRYGVLTKAEWQPMFATIATGLTQQEAGAPPVAPAAGVAAA